MDDILKGYILGFIGGASAMFLIFRIVLFYLEVL